MSDRRLQRDPEQDGVDPAKGTITAISTKFWELFDAIKDFYHTHQRRFNISISISIFTIQMVFQDEIEQLLPAAFSTASTTLSSNAGIASLVALVIALQAWNLKRLSGLEQRFQETHSARTDGGRDTPPRDSKGRFTKDSGPSLLLIIAVLAAGYLMGSQYGNTEALVGLLLAFLFLSITDNI